MYGEHIGTLNVYRKVDKTKFKLWSLSGDQGNKWIKNTIQLTALNKFKVSVLD